MKQFKSFLGYWVVLCVILSIMFFVDLISQKKTELDYSKLFFIVVFSFLISFSLIYVYSFFKNNRYSFILTLLINFILGLLHSFLFQLILEKNYRVSIIIFQAALLTVILFALIVLRKYKLLKFIYVEFNFGIKKNLLLIGKSYLLFSIFHFPFHFESIKQLNDYLGFFYICFSPIIVLFINYFFYFFLKSLKTVNLLKIILCCFFTFLVFVGINSLFFDIKQSNVVPTLITYFFPLSFILFYVFSSYNKSIKLQIKNNLKTQQYQDLKNQINPHFLFNNLNTMISFIEENPKKAIAFGHHLAGVYRHYLKNSNGDFISLIDELSFIQNYLDIYKAKFNNSLEFTLPTEISKSDYILSSVLQEIIDNIFKHNVIDAENIMKIEISKDNNFLVFTNSKVLKINVDSTKMGLSNISKRYELLTNQKLIINDSDIAFEVQIPILKYED